MIRRVGGPVLTPLIPAPFGRGEAQPVRRPPSPHVRRGGQGVRTLRAAILVTVAACSSGPSAEHHVAVAAVAVSPRSVVLRVGQAAQLIAVPLDAHGVPLARTVAWASDDSAVATVTGTGRVAGLAAGRATITATPAGRSGATGASPLPPRAAGPRPPL